MAHAFDPDALDPDVRRLKNSDEAWLANLALIRKITEEEKQAEQDRQIAARLAGVTLNENSDDRRRMAMLIDDFDDEPIHIPATRTTTNAHSQPKPKRCTICMDSVNKNDPYTPCGHAYCIECLRNLFQASMQDETLMPPSCCQKKIPIDLARFTLKETEDFNAKLLEYSTPNRLYCSQPTCSTFIPPTYIVNSVGTCPKKKCGVTTCFICKAASHGNADCPKDEATAAVLAAALAAGWTRCYRCRAVVELAQGCYHMTCRCRAEFCYLCSKPWKNCPCPQWDERRLLVEARVLNARIPHGERPQADDRLGVAQRVERMANQLRANHECRHTGGWVYTKGGGQCDECRDYLRQYLYRCRQCQFMACNRCRRNRL